MKSHVKNEDVLQRDEVESIVLRAIKRKKANLIGHVLHRNCLLKHFMKRKIEGTGRQGRRCKKLVEDLREREDTEI